MSTKLTSKFKLLNAKKILDIFTSTTDSVYCFLGKVDPWTPDDNTPDTIVDSLGSDITNWDEMVYAKKITTNDVSLVIPLKEWDSTQTTTYDPHEHDVDLSIKNFYITNITTGRVYKCISNNSNSLSTVEPTGTNTNDVEMTSDGYVWKYMYTANAPDITKFVTDSKFPIKELLLKGGNSDQWEVQENAVSGGIHHIKSTKATPDFSTYTIGHAVAVVGDGSGFTSEITLHVASGKKYVNITNPGTGYTKVSSVTVNGVADSDLKAIISPISGNGFNAAREFDVSALMITCEFTTTEPELGLGTVDDPYNDYRKFGLILNPIADLGGVGTFDTITTGGTTISSGARYTDNVADQRIRVEWQNPAGQTQAQAIDYDTVVYQGSDLASATAVGYVTSRDSVNDYLYIVTTSGSFLPTLDITDGSNTLQTANINTITSSTDASTTILYPLKRYSGDIIYIDHQEPIYRSVNKETVRLVIQF